MRIINRLKLRPFSHLPGIRVLLPHTTWEAEVFPTKVFFHNLAGKEQEEINLSVEGPVQKFTVLQNLEKEDVKIQGHGKRGYFSFDLMKMLPKKIEVHSLSKNEKRLSFGVYKKQDWDLICRRKDPAEIFPFWIRLAQCIPSVPLPKKRVGTMHLLEKESLLSLFQVGFVGLLSPRLRDENYLGIIPETPSSSHSLSYCPLGILHEGAQLIESLFFQEEGEIWHFLPALPKELHAGKFTGIVTSHGEVIDFEWSKKTLKKVIIYPKKERSVCLALQRKIKSFRIRYNLQRKGSQVPKETELQLKPNAAVYLDRFMH